jgi:hypothetical protein
MKSIFVVIAFLLSVTGCGTTKPIAAAVHQETIGAVQITFDDTGNWIKLVSTGVAPTPNKSAQAVSEATKIASMRAKQNIAEFLNNDIRSDKTVEVVSKSMKHSSTVSDKNAHEENGADNTASGGKTDTEKSDDEIKTLTTVVEHIRDNSNTILRGVQVTNQTISPESVWVEVTVSKQSIAASQSLRTTMNGSMQ